MFFIVSSCSEEAEIDSEAEIIPNTIEDDFIQYEDDSEEVYDYKKSERNTTKM